MCITQLSQRSPFDSTFAFSTEHASIDLTFAHSKQQQSAGCPHKLLDLQLPVFEGFAEHELIDLQLPVFDGLTEQDGF